MNGTVIDGGKVHLLTEKAARCGVGKQPAGSQWQMDLGEVTCQRCVKLRLIGVETGPAANHTKHANELSTTDQHG